LIEYLFFGDSYVDNYRNLIVAVLSNNPPSGVENNLEYQKYIMNLPCAKIIFHIMYKNDQW